MLQGPSTLFEFTRETSSLCDGGIHLLGFEFDGTACFRKGTVEGPNALRDVSFGIESYSPYLKKDLEDYSNIFDLGNLTINRELDVESQWRQATDAFFEISSGIQLDKQKTKIVTLGGEHSISYAPICTYLKEYNELLLLHLDAHADLRDGYEGYKYSHASIMRRVLDHFGPKHTLVQYGIRSGTKEEYKWMEENKTLLCSLEKLIETLEKVEETRPIYLTLDLDYFDPSFFPGTGTPEPGGESFHSFVKLMKILDTKNFVGADIVELSPSIDKTGNSSVFAAKVVREILLALSDEVTL